mgnify:CR=1 FL=1
MLIKATLLCLTVLLLLVYGKASVLLNKHLHFTFFHSKVINPLTRHILQ